MSKVYSDLKVFNYPDFVNNLQGGINNPLHIRLKPTNRCNHSCNYCSYRDKKQTLGSGMGLSDQIPQEKMWEIVNDIISLNVKAVTFSGGGEPTLYPHLDRYAERLAQCGVKIALITNGSLFRGKIAKVFAQYGSWVRISIDGWNRKSYKKYRGVDNFEEVISNIYNFQSKTCRLGLNIVVTEENAPHIFELVERLSYAEIDNIKISLCVINDDVKKNASYHKRIKKIVSEQIRKARFCGIPIYDTYHTQLSGFEKGYTWCPNIQIRPVIGADCGLYTCHDKAYSEKGLLGSLKNQRLPDVWEKAEKFKINPSQDCKHHCIADNRNKMIMEFLETQDREFA